MADLRNEDMGTYVNFLRMEPDMFRELLERVAPRITKMTTNYRKPIPPGHRLAVTLRYYATGTSYRDMRFPWRVRTTASARLSCRCLRPS